MTYRCILIASLLLIAALVAPSGDAAAPQTRQYDLTVSFDIPHSKITGLAKIQISRGEPVLLRAGRLAVRSVEQNRKFLSFQLRNGTLTTTAPASGTLQIRYEGLFEPKGAISGSRDTDIASVIGREGISLTSAWYPQIAGPAIYRLKAALPRGYLAVSEAESIDKIESGGGVTFSFQFDHPVDAITLVASDRYQITPDHLHGIALSAYFFPEDQTLAKKYLDYAKKYLELYESLLLPFPFKRFAIVENFLPTGYSMPTYTLLGQEVLRLPFIVETSLGHEVLHQWFGNQVYGSEKGNWTEGLTTYLADHLYEDRKGEGWRYRKQILIDFGSYVHDDKDFPLKNFTSRFDAASRSIGYGKAAMVFHMLRQRVGDEAFFGALKTFLREKQFKRASWDDLNKAFSSQSGQELSWFFDQWIKRKGLVELQMGAFTVTQSAGAFALDFDLTQNGEIYRLDVPLKVVYRSGGEKNLRIRLEERKKRVHIDLAKEPSELVMDENFDLARKLTQPEVPPVIASLLAAEKRIVVLPARDTSFYQEVIAGLRARGAEVKAAESLSDADLRSATLVLLGKDHPLVHRLYGSVEMADAGFNLLVKKNPWNPMKTVGIIAAGSAAEAMAAWPKILHYGKYSQLAFENGRNVAATVEVSERGMRKRLKEDPPAVDLSTLKTLSNVVEKVARKKIVYIGEEHDKYSHHQLQLEILRALHQQSPKIAVGMEMFQRPFQKALDEYSSGAIDERTFLKQSEYFKRWGFDYNLYKPILDFARAQRLPVVALNAPREIVDKVAKGGLDSLSKEEKQEIPQQLDFSDQEYRARLKEVFAAHADSQQKNFDFFYQAQVLWDETMAESIDRFIKKNPEFRMVVLAGAGHLEYGSGIPRRSFRRNRLDYAIVLSDAEVRRDIANFVVFPEPSKTITAPRLMVVLDEHNQRVRIVSFAKDSVAAAAGLKVEDTLVALDDQPVSSIDDVRIALFYKQPGETLKVKARRGNLELEISVKLQ
jgi:aminopeptidase N